MRRPNARSPESHNNKSNKMESPSKLHFRPSTNTTSLFSNKSKKPNYCVIIILITTLAFFSYLLFAPKHTSNATKFAIIIDGGSSGTRVHILEFLTTRDGSPVYDFSKLASMKVKPGLSALKDDPENAGGLISELLEFSKKKIPEKYWGNTEVRLMATAGLRLLDLEIQEEILESCRKVIRVSGFKFMDNWASVISGSDEGKYAWVVANYALGSLGGDPMDTTGIIELGGASAQVTFVAREPVPAEQSHSLKFGNYTYNLYSQSFLHYGQDVAFESLRESLVSSDAKLENQLSSKDEQRLLTAGMLPPQIDICFETEASFLP